MRETTTCPKCKSSAIRRVAQIVSHSSLEDGPVEHPFVEGDSCLLCGYWADAGVTSSTSIPNGYTHRPGSTHHVEQLRTHWAFVDEARRREIGWKSIVASLSTKGVNIPYKTIVKLYSREKAIIAMKKEAA